MEYKEYMDTLGEQIQNARARRMVPATGSMPAGSGSDTAAAMRQLSAAPAFESSMV